MKQTGFILPTLPIAAWGAIAAAVLFLGMSLVIKLQHDKIASCKAQVEAQKVMIQNLGAQIKMQNEAIQGWQNSAAAAKAKGKKATVAAQQEVKKKEKEINRLNGLLQGHQNQSKTCQDALRDVRKGLLQP